ncbi:MAG: ABC transporter ATP-binding protein [Flavobacteriales bacterium]
MSTLMYTEGLSIGHGRTALLRDLDLRFEQGELVALIGVNGCGKSTLLRTLAGVQPPISGRIVVQDQRLSEMTSIARARAISVVLTGRPQAGLLDVRTLVSLGRQPWTGHLGRLTETDHIAVDRAIEHTGIGAFVERGLHTLSDGEGQKVLVARALAQDTPMVLLDEPTAYLDLVNRVRILRLLRDIAHGLGKAVVFSTHDVQTAFDLCDRFIVLHDGKAWMGTPAEAMTSGIMDRVFADEHLRFDPVSASFRPR